mgnify:CR=1 FL=1
MEIHESGDHISTGRVLDAVFAVGYNKDNRNKERSGTHEND